MLLTLFLSHTAYMLYWVTYILQVCIRNFIVFRNAKNYFNMYLLTLYTVKKVSDFPFPNRDVNYSRPGRVWTVKSPAGDWKIVYLFYSVARRKI